MIDKKTTYLKLPLPNVDNELEDDCPRLEEAFKKLDAHAAAGDARLESVEASVGNLEQRTVSNAEAVGTLEGRASTVEDRALVLESKLEETSATLQAHGTALQNCDAALRDHAEGLIDLSNNKVSKVELEVIEASVTALSTTLIGAIFPLTCADSYVPNGAVPADAAEYTREQFREFYDTYLAGGKLLTCTYAAFAAQVALTGNCAKFALDKDAQKFKVPLYKDGDSITQALSTAELGKSVKAGLPDVTGEIGRVEYLTYANSCTGAFYADTAYYDGLIAGTGSRNTNHARFALSRGNPIYRSDVATVLDEQVRLRHFVVVASAQNSASVFDWSNYMAGLAGKANLDLSNIDGAAKAVIKKTARPVSLLGTRTTTGLWTITNVTPFVPIEIYLGVAAVDSYSAQIRTQGAAGLEITTLDWVLGSASGYMRPHMASLLPNASIVTVNVTQISAGVTLAAYQ